MTFLSVETAVFCLISADADAWLVMETAREKTMAADKMLVSKFFFIKNISFQKYGLLQETASCDIKMLRRDRRAAKRNFSFLVVFKDRIREEKQKTGVKTEKIEKFFSGLAAEDKI